VWGGDGGALGKGSREERNGEIADGGATCMQSMTFLRTHLLTLTPEEVVPLLATQSLPPPYPPPSPGLPQRSTPPTGAHPLGIRVGKAVADKRRQAQLVLKIIRHEKLPVGELNNIADTPTQAQVAPWRQLTRVSCVEPALSIKVRAVGPAEVARKEARPTDAYLSHGGPAGNGHESQFDTIRDRTHRARLAFARSRAADDGVLRHPVACATHAKHPMNDDG